MLSRQTRDRRRSPWGAAAAVGLIGLAGWGWAQCTDGPSGPGMAPGLTWDGRGLAVAWADDEHGDVAVRTWYWVPEEGAGEIETAARVAALYSPPELVRGDRSYLLALDRGSDGLAMLPLSRDQIEAHAGGEPVRVLCRAPVAIGERFAIAVGTGTGDEVAYQLLIVDRDGRVAERQLLARGVAARPACAIGRRDRGLGVVASLDRGDRRELVIAAAGTVQTVASGGTLAPLRLVAHGDGWLLLFHRDDRAQLAFIRGDGQPGDITPLAAEIPPATVDLAVSDRGPAIAWSAGKRILIAPLDGHGRELARCQVVKRARSSQVRAIAAGPRWALAWTELGGMVVAMSVVSRCGTDGADVATVYDQVSSR